MTGKSSITSVVGVRLENELREIIWEKARLENTTPSKLIKEAVRREFKGEKRRIDKRQLSLI